MGYLSKVLPLNVGRKKDAMVIEKIKSGDDRQLASIYEEYRSEFIFWITKHYHCSMDEAKDVYQFSILTFYENIISNRLVELKSSVKTYLFAIGKNKILEKRKDDRRMVQIVDDPVLEVDELEKEEILEKETNLQLVEKCLEQLGDPCKSLLELYYYNRMSMEEITETLNYKNANTAKNLKYKCMNRLKRLFEDESKKQQSR